MERGLQGVVAFLGMVAVTAAAATLFTGGALILDGGTVSPSVDSELRFHAAWYLMAGCALLWAARRIRERGFVVAWASVALLVAACARVVSLVTVGTPHRLYLILTVVEFVLPAILLPWLRAVNGRRVKT